jgi:hypothetical protein
MAKGPKDEPALIRLYQLSVGTPIEEITGTILKLSGDADRKRDELCFCCQRESRLSRCEDLWRIDADIQGAEQEGQID